MIKIHKTAELNKASGAVPLYAYRPVLNAEEIIAWAKANGFAKTLLPDDMHVTVCFSRRPFSAELSEFIDRDDEHFWWFDNEIPIHEGNRSVEPLGDKGAVVLKISSDMLEYEWQSFIDRGASWDYESYQPHITLTYENAPDVLPAPFDRPIILGAMRFRELDPEGGLAVKEANDESRTEKALSQESLLAGANRANSERKPKGESMLKFAKVDDEQRIVWGWAFVTKQDGEVVVDSQKSMISGDVLEKAATDFMLDVRRAKAMHEGSQVGEFIHSFPLTADLAKAFGIECDREGWIVAAKVHDDDTWAKVKDGSFSGFSIGGRAQAEEAT